MVSNTRGPETLSKLVDELGPFAQAGSAEDAIAAGDIVTLSVPLAILERVPADKLAEKVVLDQSNYYPGLGEFRRADLDDGELTSRRVLPAQLYGLRQGGREARLPI